MNAEKQPSAPEKRGLLPRKARSGSRGGTDAPDAVDKGSTDIPKLLITTILVLFCCVMVYSASAIYAEQYHDDSTYFIVRHIVFLLIGVAATAILVKYCTPVFWEDFSWIIFGISVVLLLLVLVIGDDLGSGAKRWLNFGFFTVQPSEVAKLGLVLAMAKFMTVHEKQIRSTHRFGGSFL